MSHSPSRRRFLTMLGAGSAAAVLPQAAVAGASSAASQPLVTVLDLSKCVGCGECALACKEANAAKFPVLETPIPKMFPKRVKVEDWSDKQDVDDRLTPYSWLFVEQIEGEHDGQPFALNVPRRCMHCVNPPCANLCPWGSCSKDARGTVSINTSTCLGGAKCRTVCPWSIPQRQSGVGLYRDLLPRFAGNGVMYKCDRCQDRLEHGRQPACIEACEYGVQTVGPRDEMFAKATELAESMGGYLYGQEENGGTNTIYVSPVPFDMLEQAREKGPGRPNLAPAADPFENETTLTAALVMAPLAGLAGAALKVFAGVKKEADHG